MRGDEAADDRVAFVVLVLFHPPVQGFFGGVGEVVQTVGEKGRNREGGKEPASSGGGSKAFFLECQTATE